MTEQFNSEILDDGLETNLLEIARHVFSQPVGRPYSIGLQLDHPVDSGKSAAQVLQEMLLLFLLSGTAVKYGDAIKFSDLTESQRDTLRQYMWSVGYDPVIHTDDQGFWIDFVPYRA
jgi:hypothetical protein